MKYIATREGVQVRPGSGPVSKKQEQLIQQILRDFPDCEDLFEYEDYLASPTAATASAFISVALDANAYQIAGESGYMKYISLRPGAELHGTHGLFGAAPAVDLSSALKELEQHGGNVWTVIYSLRREDAARLGYDNADAWRSLLLSKQFELAKAMKIEPQDFRWYAAFHDAGHHPHIHMMVWSADPAKGYLTKDGIKQMRSAMTTAIFQNELLELYQRKDVSYKELTEKARQVMGKLSRELASGIRDGGAVAEKLLALSNALDGVSGKKQYGYLKKPLKAMVDSVVDELENIPEVAACYQAWNAIRDEQESYYHQSPRQHLPLSQQKEFRSIKNAVIREAEALRTCELTFEDSTVESLVEIKEAEEPEEAVDIEPELFPSPEDTPPVSSVPFGSRQPRTVYDQAREYRAAKQRLYDEAALPEEQAAALAALERLWEEGFSVAAHLLGKAYRDGMAVPMDNHLALLWFRRSAEAGNDYSEYALGKLLLKLDRAAEALPWLHKAAARGNQHAQYQLGKLYLAGNAVPKDTVQALRFLKNSAFQGNQFAQYTLGKLYLLGKDVPRDTEEAVRWLRMSAHQGNQYAQFFLDHLDQYHDPSVLLPLLRLLHHLSRTFRENAAAPPPPGLHIDSKRRRLLMEKRLAMGHKVDDHEDPANDLTPKM